MTAIREELHHLVDDLPDEQLSAALAMVRQLTPEPEDAWPPPWFGSITSGRHDTAVRAKQIVRDELGANRRQ